MLSMQAYFPARFGATAFHNVVPSARYTRYAYGAATYSDSGTNTLFLSINTVNRLKSCTFVISALQLWLDVLLVHLRLLLRTECLITLGCEVSTAAFCRYDKNGIRITVAVLFRCLFSPGLSLFRALKLINSQHMQINIVVFREFADFRVKF